MAIIGEAAKHVSVEVKEKISDIEWSKITALRNILIHEYAGIDNDIIWDIIQTKLPDLKKKVSSYIKKS